MVSNGYFISRYKTSGDEEYLKTLLIEYNKQDMVYEAMHKIYSCYYKYITDDGMSQKEAYNKAFNDFQNELQAVELER